MAAGDTILEFHPNGNEPPAAAYATYSRRNAHPILQFDDTVNESAVWTAIMPRHYNGNGLKVRVHWAHVAGAGDVDWDGSFERIGDEVQDIDADGFAAVQSADNCPVAANSGDVSIDEIAFTDGAQIDGILVGESFRMKLARDAVSDTAVGDAQLVMIELRESV